MGNLTKKALRLSLKKVWYIMTSRYDKIEEYRELTPYWYARLCLYDNLPKTQKFWTKYIVGYGSFDSDLVTFKNFDYNIMTLGYQKKSEVQRVKVFNHVGIRIDYGKKEWGAVEGVKYFVITHGEML